MMRALFVLLIAVGAADAEPLRLGTDGDFPPNVMTLADGSLSGFEPALADIACPLATFECSWVILPFDQLEPALVAGEIDAIMAGLSQTGERSERMLFTDAYLTPAESLFVTLAGRKVVLEDARIAAQRGTIQAGHITSIGAELVETETQEAALAALRAGRADVLLATASWLNQQDTAGLREVGEPVTIGNGAAMALRLDEVATATRLNTALSELTEDGRLEALRLQWFGAK